MKTYLLEECSSCSATNVLGVKKVRDCGKRRGEKYQHCLVCYRTCAGVDHLYPDARGTRATATMAGCTNLVLKELAELAGKVEGILNLMPAAVPLPPTTAPQSGLLMEILGDKPLAALIVALECYIGDYPSNMVDPLVVTLLETLKQSQDRRESCPQCDGTGRDDVHRGSIDSVCGMCEGYGYIYPHPTMG